MTNDQRHETDKLVASAYLSKKAPKRKGDTVEFSLEAEPEPKNARVGDIDMIDVNSTTKMIDVVCEWTGEILSVYINDNTTFEHVLIDLVGADQVLNHKLCRNITVDGALKKIIFGRNLKVAEQNINKFLLTKYNPF